MTTTATTTAKRSGMTFATAVTRRPGAPARNGTKCCRGGVRSKRVRMTWTTSTARAVSSPPTASPTASSGGCSGGCSGSCRCSDRRVVVARAASTPPTASSGGCGGCSGGCACSERRVVEARASSTPTPPTPPEKSEEASETAPKPKPAQARETGGGGLGGRIAGLFRRASKPSSSRRGDAFPKTTVARDPPRKYGVVAVPGVPLSKKRYSPVDWRDKATSKGFFKSSYPIMVLFAFLSYLVLV